MDEQRFIEYFVPFGLTRQEVLIYKCLLTEGKKTGYEMAKATGISRSNVYGALAALVEKGAAYQLEEQAKKYVAVPLPEFCDNHIHKLQEKKEWLLSNLPKKQETQGSYITIEGNEHILNKIGHLLESTQERAYVSCTASFLDCLETWIQKLLEKKKKVVVITDGICNWPFASVYSTSEKGKQIGIITDSKYVLTGEIGEGSRNTCLYSDEPNFVQVFKDAMANEIKIITYERGV